MILFADDLIIYSTIRKIDYQITLQADVDLNQHWVVENGIKLNAAKTAMKSFT